MRVSLIVALSNTDDASRGALDHAIALSKRLQTDLHAIAPLPDPSGAFIYASSEFAVGVGTLAVAQVREAQEELVADLQEMVSETCGAAGLEAGKWRFEHVVGLPDMICAQAAVLSDGIVFPRLDGKSPSALSRAFESVLMDARLPVLLPGAKAFTSGPVVIAWDGSPEAARAVMFHEPLIRTFDRAIIAQNPDDLKPNRDGEAGEPARLEAWLERRGVAAERATFSGGIAKGLLEAASDAALLVMGAYGHSRAGEFLFGGATRGVLKAEAGPALALSH